MTYSFPCMQNGVNGLLIHPSEVELAENLIKVIKNKKLRRSVSSNAVNKAKQYSWKHIYEEDIRNL